MKPNLGVVERWVTPTHPNRWHAARAGCRWLLHIPGMSCGVAMLSVATAANASSPFPTRDQNPLIADFGLPTPLPAEMQEGWSLDASFNWSSSAIAKSRGNEALIADAETRELRVVAARSIGDRFALQLELPYRYIGPGVLDSFIDDWHELFDLPEGARPLLPRDQLLIVYERNGQRVVDERTSLQGLANVTASLGMQVADTERTNVAFWLSLKLPTSRLDLPGHDSTDVSLSMAAARGLAPRWSIYGQASVAVLGEDDAISRVQQRTAWSGLAGVSARVWRNLDLKLQLDGHTAVMDSELDYLGEAVVLTFGGSYDFEGWRLNVGISEDIFIDASPDVVFVLGVQRSPRHQR